MKIKILSKQISSEVPEDDVIFDSSVKDVFYIIKTLQVGCAYQDEIIEVDEPDEYGQIYIKEYDIFIQSHMYEIV
jgi:hypothetical protein